ncbi:hypothetical protein GGR56DRAFT_267208 [Xylariaceae sp. FL0804]|nr:hypothetical protein GGR56DRAFT_267208 [Xylariaceae sp. FL0804]
MEEKAKVFCTGSDSPLKAITASWIEKFKQKQGLGPGKLIRRASETAIPDSTRLDRLDRLDDGSPLLSAASQTSGGISPASPAAPQAASSPQPSSANGPAVGGGGKDATAGSSSGFMDFESSSASAGAYRHPHSSQSTTSLSSGLTDPPSSTFSAGAFSPSSQQFTFSPDPNTGLFGGPGHGSANFQRPRSQTVPNIEPLEYLNGGGGPPLPHPQQQREEEDRGEPLTPRYSASGTAPSSALESPAHELAAAPPFGVLDAAISPPQHHALHHASSSSSLAGRSSAASGAAGATATATATGGGGGGGGGAGGSGSSGPGSPTQEDARRAADTLLSFMQHQGTGWLLDQNEYLIFVRLAEKLGLGTPQQQQQQQQQHQHVAAPKASSAIQGLGGLSRIPEGDIEMANTHTHSPLLKREEGPMN